MAEEEVEKKFLVKKLKETINQVKTEQKSLLSKLSCLGQRLEELNEALNSKNTTISKETLYSINNLLGEWQIPSKRSNLPFLLHFRSQILSLKKEIESSSTENNNQNAVATVTTTTMPQSLELSTRFPDSINVYGVDDKIRFLVRKLALRRESDGTEFRSVGISGMRCVGKTRLCQEVFKHPTIQSYFLPRIWVCLSMTNDEQKHYRKVIVKRILSALFVEEDVVKYADEKHGLEGLLFLMRVNLSGKNYLIVLDDVPKEEEGEFFSDLNKDEDSRQKLAYGLPKGFGGGVMVTSRWAEMVKLMVGSDNLQSLTADLDPESCWSIFKDEAKEVSDDMIALKAEIIKMCDGLPMSAKLLGKLARKKD